MAFRYRGSRMMDEQKLLERITDRVETTLEGYPWLEAEDVRACLAYARRPLWATNGPSRSCLSCNDFRAIPFVV